MARNVWDDIADDGVEDASTRVKGPSSGEIAPRRRGALPWLLFGLTAAVLGGSLAKSLEGRQESRRQLAAARDEAAEMRRNLFVAQDKLSSTEKKANTEASEAAALRRAVVSQSAEKETQDKLLADLRAKLDAKEGDVSSEGALVTVNLVDEVLFKSGDANLAPRGKEVLAKVGDVLKKLTDKQILIGGHTDTVPIHTPQFPSNWELSSARAVNVVHFLAETVGVDPAKLTAAGFGEFHPRSKKNKAKNRRIEILLTPAVESAKK